MPALARLFLAIRIEPEHVCQCCQGPIARIGTSAQGFEYGYFVVKPRDLRSGFFRIGNVVRIRCVVRRGYDGCLHLAAGGVHEALASAVTASAAKLQAETEIAAIMHAKHNPSGDLRVVIAKTPMGHASSLLPERFLQELRHRKRGLVHVGVVVARRELLGRGASFAEHRTSRAPLRASVQLHQPVG